MTYEETLEWMFGRLPMYQERGKDAYSAKLDPIKKFASYLGDPQKRFKSIHVGGTNGKGSSSHLLASILQEAGYKVGLYTSPHLKDFRERIKINGKTIGKQQVIGFIEEHQDYLQLNSLSFFEMTVGMAFDYFAEQAVDIAIIEVGLGGRLDSTNIITPEVSLITNIGMDHTDLLGNDLASITREKAGIIKPGVPVVISEYEEETATIFSSTAAANGSRITFAEKLIKNIYPTALLGNYQIKNIKGVLATLHSLNGFDVGESNIKMGLLKVVENTGLLGRWQVLAHSPKIICDTAHNREGLKIVLEQLLKEKFDHLHIVLGFVQDKRLDSILPLMPKEAKYYLARPNIRRGLDVNILFEEAQKFRLNCKTFNSIPAALESARAEANPEDLIFVGGSTFTVAEVV